jgi:hypothetical protein
MDHIIDGWMYVSNIGESKAERIKIVF